MLIFLFSLKIVSTYHNVNYIWKLTLIKLFRNRLRNVVFIKWKFSSVTVLKGKSFEYLKKYFIFAIIIYRKRLKTTLNLCLHVH